MKGFLFDENVPVPLRFVPSLPVVHATSLGNSPSDGALWTYATRQQLAIITKDADFSDRIIATSPPPWVVHLRFGNLQRAAFETLLASAWPRIATLLPDHKLIRVFVDRIETFSE